MKTQRAAVPVLAAGIFMALNLFSCASAAPVEEAPLPEVQEAPRQSFLPLREGWYRYDFERKFKGVEDEYTFALTTGMRMVAEITLKQTGSISYCEEGILHDPVLNMDLLVDEEGRIRSPGLSSVSGRLREDGGFIWTALVEELGRLTHVTVRGRLSYLPRERRGGDEYDGVYHLIDEGTGREQLVRIEEGLYSWSYLDGEEAGFTPWPTLIEPEGSFFFGMELTTVMVMGDFSQANFSTSFETSGKVIPPGSGEGPPGISLQTVSHTGGISTGGEGPQVYGGAPVREGEFPNEKIPPGAGGVIRPKVAAAKSAPGVDWTRLPSWYRELPAKPGYIYAAGQKTFENRDTATALAEAAAAADLAVRLEARIESALDDRQGGAGNRTESRFSQEAAATLKYRVAETVYDEAAGTAYVLLEYEEAPR
jgi:hypothetical protein